jgi:hypothetical protein
VRLPRVRTPPHRLAVVSVWSAEESKCYYGQIVIRPTSIVRYLEPPGRTGVSSQLVGSRSIPRIAGRQLRLVASALTPRGSTQPVQVARLTR